MWCQGQKNITEKVFEKGVPQWWRWGRCESSSSCAAENAAAQQLRAAACCRYPLDMSEGRHGSDAQPSSSSSSPAAFAFGPYTIPPSTVFAATALSFAFVNLRPAVPGHVLVATRASRALFRDLLPAEVADVWKLAQRVGVAVSRSFDCKGLQFAVQDGAASGQTVPHLHIHVVRLKRLSHCD